MTNAFLIFCELLSERTELYRHGQYGSEQDHVVAGKMEPLVTDMEPKERELAGIILKNQLPSPPPVVEG